MYIWSAGNIKINVHKFYEQICLQFVIIFYYTINSYYKHQESNCTTVMSDGSQGFIFVGKDL